MKTKTKHADTGEVRPECERCSGVGEIRNEIFMDDHFDEMMECPHCQGRGWSVEPRPQSHAMKDNRKPDGSDNGVGSTGGSAAWWLSGWQRKYRAVAAYYRDDVYRVLRRLVAAEDRYQRENQMGKYAAVTRRTP